MSFEKDFWGDYIEKENSHIFAHLIGSNRDNLYEQEGSLEDALIQAESFGDGFCQANNLDEIDNSDENDPFGFLYSSRKEKLDKKEEIKSWLINLETKEPRLSIGDIEDGEIPEILKDYDWLVDLEIDCQKIKEIKNLPKNLKELSLFNNQIEKIPENELPETLEILNLSRNKIKVLENIPKSVKELDVANNLIKICNIKFNFNLKELSIESNLMEIFPDLPESLIKLDISQNLLTEIPESIIDSIEDMDFSLNNISQVSKFPENLKRLVGYNNKIRILIKLPQNLEFIDLSFNELMWLPNLPDSLKRADFSNNKIVLIALFNSIGAIDNINGNLSGNYNINLSYNPLTNVPKHILRDTRVKHNLMIEIEEPPKLERNYYKITHAKTIVL